MKARGERLGLWATLIPQLPGIGHFAFWRRDSRDISGPRPPTAWAPLLGTVPFGDLPTHPCTHPRTHPRTHPWPILSATCFSEAETIPTAQGEPVTQPWLGALL